MTSRCSPRFTYANVVATLALFVALGGSSYAAVVITGKNVKDNSLTSKDVKNGSLLRKDFKSRQLPQGATGRPGPPGPTGAKGDAGPQGAPGVSGLHTVHSTTTADSSDTKAETARCPAGKQAISGGYDVNISEPGFFHTAPPAFAVDDRPLDDDGWFVRVREDNSWATDGAVTNSWSLTVYVKCASVTP